jgi:hypothetical protein
MQFSAGSGEKFKMAYVWQTLKDYKTYIASMSIRLIAKRED